MGEIITTENLTKKYKDVLAVLKYPSTSVKVKFMAS